MGNLPGVVEFRGQGLMIGMELDRPRGVILTRAMEAGPAAERDFGQGHSPAASTDLHHRTSRPDCGHSGSAGASIPVGKCGLRHETRNEPDQALPAVQDLRAPEYEYLFERAAIIKKRFKNYEKYTRW